MFSALAAAGSVVAASSCCLPLGTLWLAAGFAGASALLAELRPWLMLTSVALIGLGFWQARRAKACRGTPARFQMILLWTSAVLVGISLLFPQVLAQWLAKL
ncbi:MAG: hypothetical protein M3O35_01220 [Acidobacteriota bacterium]|nr:hypothetical protein [Acidobacteriota bacterium]